MPTLLRNVLALLAGIVVGGSVNMALITLGPSLVPPPAGADVSTAEGLRSAIHSAACCAGTLILACGGGRLTGPRRD